MPLIKIDMIKGREKAEIKEILDISYRVMLETFGAPEGDRYQIVNQHEDYEMQILDTGLGVERTENVLVFTIVTRPRTQSEKTNFYQKLADTLHKHTDIRKEDIMISLVENTDEDWSFFNGKAQFLTGDL
ncbi:tautomerase family protein [Staphylococcus succinus]|jgi:phenylpyruvate tautomerase PptA (4-oxalocrotonate tautomerase family)|uniref:Tautomerase family protein n=1 Tax=Staphylococcus succinus TaxID=61015 RepID=A0A9Q6HRF9_9STAP|nr:tautomerase family protein [Staphylococcus succinus]MEB7462869.1 tautomerase family protein [Staphylococcus succinus]MEB8127492.1 tautomerase family protein [Staphylococcus succinus]MEB8210330.1 tautomerase family protein [Staphylococcus succinus]PTI44295.1 tautomerase family protein [Staphylococcus succinus]PTI47143.1 tautomerase family protein [Staphylococcus succinus]